MTLPLALAIEQDYPAYAPYPLLSPLVGFADDTNLTVAHTLHEPHAPDPRGREFREVPRSQQKKNRIPRK